MYPGLEFNLNDPKYVLVVFQESAMVITGCTHALARY